MSKIIKVPNYDPIIKLVLDVLDSSETRRKYQAALSDFIAYVAQNPQELNRACVQEYKAFMLEQGTGGVSIRLAAIKKLAYEAYQNELISHRAYMGIKDVSNPRTEGRKVGNWLTKKEAIAVLRKPDANTLKGLRDRAILAVFLGAGLRRSECASLTFEHVQQREGRWVLVDLVGKRNKVRSIPIASWVYHAVHSWAETAGLESGFVFRSMNKGGRITGESMTAQALRNVSMQYAGLPPHDLRRSFAKLASNGGAELDQISLSLGHASLETTQRYLGLELDFHNAPSDKVGLKL